MYFWIKNNLFFEVETSRQSWIFRILRQILKYVFRRICRNLKVQGQDRAVSYLHSKRESKNSSIHPKNDWSKIAKFSVVFLYRKQAQLVSIITSRHRHGFGLAFALLQAQSCRSIGSFLGRIGVDDGISVCNGKRKQNAALPLFR